MIPMERVHKAYRAVIDGRVSGVPTRHVAEVVARAYETEFLDDQDTALIEKIELMERMRARNIRVVQ